MRSPFLACLALASLFGLTTLVACAKSDDDDLLGAFQDKAPTEPEADSGGGSKLPPKSQEKSPPVVLDAGKPDSGPVDAGKDAAKEEEEEPEEPEEQPECPANSLLHSIAAIGSTKSCVNGGSDCSPGECCFVNIISAQANKCVPE